MNHRKIRNRKSALSTIKIANLKKGSILNYERFVSFTQLNNVLNVIKTYFLIATNHMSLFWTVDAIDFLSRRKVAKILDRLWGDIIVVVTTCSVHSRVAMSVLNS